VLPQPSKRLLVGAHVVGVGLTVLIELARLLTDLQPAGLALGAAIATGTTALTALAVHGIPGSALGAVVVAGLLALALARR
jgi:hypothetical protein